MMNYKLLLTILFIILLDPFIALAAPTIDSIAGTIDNGESIVISSTGTDFGTNAAVGTSANVNLISNIEAGEDEATFSAGAGWSVRVDSNANTVVYDTAQAHSGSKSLRMSWDYLTATPHYDSWIHYDYGTNSIKLAYIDFWVYFSPTTLTGNRQWKQWRLSDGEGGVLGRGEFLHNMYIDSSGNYSTQSNNNAFRTYDLAYVPSAADTRVGSDWDMNEWYHMKYIVEVSTDDTADGEFHLVAEHGGDVDTVDQTNLETRSGGDPDFRYFIFGLYLDIPSGDSSDSWYDDIFIQIGTQARVEICDASTLAASTHCEIQIPTAWATDEIIAAVNQGSFASLDEQYLIVIDSDGNEGSIELTDSTPPEIDLIAVNGSTWSFTFTESVTNVDYTTGDANFDCDGASGADNNLAYVSGSGTANWQFSGDAVANEETCNVDWTLSEGDVVDDASNSLETFADASVTNNTPAEAPSEVFPDNAIISNSSNPAMTSNSSYGAVYLGN
jgi:hypothetical protein